MAFSLAVAQRQGGRIIGGVFAGLTALWAPLEPITAILKVPDRTLQYGLPAAVVIYAIYKSIPARKLALRGPSDLKVEVVQGDLFAQEGCSLAVSTDDLFLTAHEKLIPPKSLIALLHQQRYQGFDQNGFDALIASAVDALSADYAEMEPAKLPPCVRARTRQFALGTTIVLRPNKDERHFLVATCKIDLKVSPPTGRATAADLVQALLGLWDAIRSNPRGTTVAVPLIGAGMTSTGLRPNDVLRLMITTLACSARTAAISDRIRIVVHPSHASEVLLDDDVLSELARA